MDEQNIEQVVIFSKFCVPCVKGEAYHRLEHYLNVNGYDWKVVRTTYLPKLHEAASRVWGGDDYTIFLYQNGRTLDFDYAVERIDKGLELFEDDEMRTKKKPVRKGKKK